MEEELLKNMIMERDLRIRDVREEIQNKVQKENMFQRQLQQVRESQQKRNLEQQRALDGLTEERDRLQHKMTDINRENKHSGALHMYADIIREASPTNVDSSYVLRMQAQLCKAMHTMGITEHQMELVKTHCGQVIKEMKDNVSAITEEKCRMEVRVMNELVVMDDIKRQAESKLKETMISNRRSTEDIGEDEEEDNDESEHENSVVGDDNESLDLPPETEKDDQLFNKRMQLERLKAQSESIRKEWELIKDSMVVAVHARNEQISQKDEEVTMLASAIEALKLKLTKMDVALPNFVLESDLVSVLDTADFSAHHAESESINATCSSVGGKQRDDGDIEEIDRTHTPQGKRQIPLVLDYDGAVECGTVEIKASSTVDTELNEESSMIDKTRKLDPTRKSEDTLKNTQTISEMRSKLDKFRRVKSHETPEENKLLTEDATPSKLAEMRTKFAKLKNGTKIPEDRLAVDRD